MYVAKGLPTCFWAEAVATTVYILNLSPTRAVRDQATYRARIGRRPIVSHLIVFGCKHMVLLKLILGNLMKNLRNIFLSVTFPNPKHINYIILLVAR